MFHRWRMLFAAMLVGSSLLTARAEETEAPEVSDTLGTVRFEQTGTIDLRSREGGAGPINTFCLDRQGRLLVAVGGTRVSTTINSEGRRVEKKETAGAVRVYSQDGELLDTWAMDFVPQAINVSPRGDVFVAGAGTIARLDEEGNVVKSGATPHISNREEFEKSVRAELKAQQRQRAKLFEQQVERAQALVDRLEKKPEEERSRIDEVRLRNAKRQLDLFTQQSEMLAGGNSIDFDSYLTYKLKVPGLAVTERDVFLAVSATKGYGYEVWRMDHDFANPTRICEGLRGCCGQMDIQAYGDELFVAENSRHRVCRYDRDGKELAAWGKSDATGVNGFEGCCNPMNLRFTPSGEVLTAESGVGLIKRFSPKGEYLGLVGKADLVGGCKHVALSATATGDHVYMLDITRSQIAVLSPTTEPQDAPIAEKVQDPQRRPAANRSVLGSVFDALFSGN